MKASTQNLPSLVDPHVCWSHRDIPLSHGHHVPGRVAWTPHAQSVPVESRLEAQVLGFLLLNPHLVAIHSQPFTLSYWDGEKHRRYTPDFLVVMDRLTRTIVRFGFGYWTIVEVKAARRMERERQRIAGPMQAIRELLGFATVCFTENDLPTRRALS
ncbi:MAG TPA: hypothetical protein VGH80_10865 [Xanthomonadaceae bacterium]|jgi:hypothetical protein